MRFRTAALALMFCTALLLVPYDGVDAQDGDFASIETRMVLTALESIDGSGNVQYRFEGAPATDLRLAVMSSYDSNGNQYMDPAEALRFFVDLGDELEGRQHWGVTIQNPTNYSSVTESEIVNCTSGLVNSVPETALPITFRYDFDASGESTTKLLRLSELAQQTFLGSVETIAGYTFEGTLEVRDRVTVFGASSYTNPDLTDGEVSELRTPLGSVLWYSLTTELGGSGQPLSETVTYENFNLLENQQVVFVLLMLGCLFVFRIHSKSFEKYMLEHPKKFRKSAKPLLAVRVFSWAIVVLLTVLYLLPFIFSSVDKNLLVYAWYFYFMVPAAVIGTYFFTRAMYNVASLKIPEDVVIEVKQAYVSSGEGQVELRCQICMMPMDADVDLYECVCGFTMHNACAHRSQSCPLCGAVLFPEHTRSVECRACKETFLTSVEEDPYALQCTKCGAFQEEVHTGKNYLVIDLDGKRAYNMLRSMGLSGRPAMVLTSEFPGKVREEHGLGDDFEVKWLTETTGDIDSVDIKDLDGDVMETVSTFLMTTKHSGLLVDGIESIVSANGFEAALAFVKRLNDLAVVHGSSILMWFDKDRLPQDQARAISDEFDELHDYL